MAMMVTNDKIIFSSQIEKLSDKELLIKALTDARQLLNKAEDLVDYPDTIMGDEPVFYIGSAIAEVESALYELEK